jgi:hypothetical protein
MSTRYLRAAAILAIAAAADLTGKEGFPYKLDAENKAVLCSAITDVPHGIILAVTPDGLEITAAVLGGNHGTVGVKLGAAVTDLRKMLTIRADGTAESDDAAGARVGFALPLEVGEAGEIIECVVFRPRVTVAALTLGNVNGAIAALTSSSTTTQAEFNALRDACETLADDVRALVAALQAGAEIG